ncbi:hypothetical protein [Rodentibacter sp. Ppn85]|nr:hypothetical protein [Rodentibacter sp. Ppn85]
MREPLVHTPYIAYTKWRGGFRRYHQRKHTQGGALKRVDEQHKDMGI